MILMAAVVKSVVGVGFRSQHGEMMATLKLRKVADYCRHRYTPICTLSNFPLDPYKEHLRPSTTTPIGRAVWTPMQGL